METIAHLTLVFLPFVLLGGCVVWHSHEIRKGLTTGDGRPIAQVFDEVVREARRANDLRAPPVN